MNKKILYYIWLSSSFRAGSKVPKIVLEHFGDIEKIFCAEKEDYESIGISNADIIALCNKNLDRAKKYYEYCINERIGILSYEDPAYPERLKIISNPPPMFYYLGRLNMLDDYPCITMVGTRSCSERGFRLAYSIAYDAANKGAVIVNGLALGIDGACISGCLDAKGYAIGVLGCGIDRIYPYGNADLFKRLRSCGLILSEFPPFTEPKPENFPTRNRVISALSLATVVFEAASGSGALITAMHALEQGRRIFAVPAKPYDKSYSGPLELIKDGAAVLTEANDILAEYSMNFPHRINLEKISTVNKDKLDAYVSKFFKKDIDPDQPVNRRFTKSSTVKDSESYVPDIVESDSGKNDREFTVKPTTPIHNRTKAEISPESKPHNATKDIDVSMLSIPELEIFKLFQKHTALTADEIAAKGIKINDILSTLTLLEIYGLITALPGGKYKITE